MAEPNCFKVTYAGRDWIDLAAKASSESEHEAMQSATLELDRRLPSMLGAERLMILTGLGTSLGVREKNKRLAPSMADLWKEASDLQGFEAAAALAPEAVETANIELLLSRCQFAVALQDDETLKKFVEGAEARILTRCRFVTAKTELPTHELFLRKVARRATRLPRTQLYTTNYDLAFERAADRGGFHLIDGFGLGKARRFDGAEFDLDFVRRRLGERPTLEPNVAQYFKLHGSVDWDGADGEIVRKDEPEAPVLIYPAQEKFRLSYERPYLECMARFQMALRDPDVALLVVGFGFNDEHIAAPIRAAVQSNVGLRIAVVTPEAQTGRNPHLAYLRELVSRGDRRVTLFATDFDTFASRLPDLAPDDEREIHRRRLDEAQRATDR